MAVSYVAETSETDGVTGQIGRRLYRRTFVVFTTSAQDGKWIVSTGVDPTTGVRIPQPYEPYVTPTEFDNGAVVRAVIPKRRNNHRSVWDVTVEYDSEYERRDNPFTEPPDISTGSEVYEFPLPGRASIFYDPNTAPPQSTDPAVAGDPALVKWGQGILTSAGEPFDPPPTNPESRPIVTFTRNQASFYISDKVMFENTVNKEPWSGLQPRQAWLRSVNATSHVQKSKNVSTPDIFYYRVEYVFALRAETWDLVLLDIGSYYLDYTTGTAVKKTFRVEGTGEPRLGLLDHSNAAQPGKKLAANQDAQYLRWRTKRELDFAPLGINLNLALKNRRAAPRS